MGMSLVLSTIVQTIIAVPGQVALSLHFPAVGIGMGLASLREERASAASAAVNPALRE